VHEENYADFAVLISDCRDRVTAQVGEKLKRFPKVSSCELLEAANDLLSSWCDQIATAAWEQAASDIKGVAGDVNTVSAMSERTVHEIKGTTNDIAFAAVRALNEAFSVIDQERNIRSGNAVRRGASQALMELIELAIAWNSLEYIADQVSYGEWVVTSVNPSGGYEVRLDIRDPVLEYARIIGLRRDAVFVMSGKERPSAARIQLERGIPGFLSSALEHLTSGTELRCGIGEFSSLERRMRQRVAELDPNDDLLLTAGSVDFPIVEDYIAALSLRWFCDIAEFIAEYVPKRVARDLSPPVTTTETICSMLPLETGQLARVQAALNSFIQVLPVRRYLGLIANPFVRLPHNQFAYIPALTGAGWPADVRAKWLRKGDVGRKFGGLWEEFLASLLEDFGWLILGRGIKLRKNGKIVTDVDLFAVREGLLLLLQIKALAGQGFNAYDHWRNRKTIEEGARQAAAAAECLETNRDILRGLGSTSAVGIKRIQPAVLTNLHIFNGWRVGDVPVVSRNGLTTILRGGVVTRHMSDGTEVDPQYFCKSETFDVAEFVDLMLNPIDWRISQESLKPNHYCKEIGEVRWNVPIVGQWASECNIPMPKPTVDPD